MDIQHEAARHWPKAWLGLALAAAAGAASAKEVGGLDDKVSSLRSVAVPTPADLAVYVKDQAALIRLGKALYWDVQAGSDGMTACATCHHKGGTDSRSVATTNPHGSTGWQANTAVTAADFPIKTSRVFGSAGVVAKTFVSVTDGSIDIGNAVLDPAFSIQLAGGRSNVRQVTGRRAPTVINAAYNHRQFWDGRAREVFNGVNPSGVQDTSARVLKVQANGTVLPVQIAIANASLASQAVGPINSDVEMAWRGRSMVDVGRKLLNPNLRPLALQEVASSDSVLGTLSIGKGLATNYADLVTAAFQPTWWNSQECVDSSKAVVSCNAPGAMNVLTANFSLFWGLALQGYQSTLIANQSRLDLNQLTAQELRGKTLFEKTAKCNDCHGGAETTQASARMVKATVPLNPAKGFFNIGLRPRAEDGGLGDAGLAGLGLTKSPHLRALDMRAPYFRNGGAATLRQVVDFYSRGGDFASGGAGTQDLKALNLTEVQKTDLIAFLLSMSDDRVKFERAPFDHPSLPLPVGVDPTTGQDRIELYPAVGRTGRAIPLPSFLGLSPYQP